MLANIRDFIEESEMGKGRFGLWIQADMITLLGLLPSKMTVGELICKVTLSHLTSGLFQDLGW